MRRHASGFSLIEMMIAIMLGLMITGAVISMFVGSRTAYQQTSGVANMTDSGRFALNFIEESARAASNLSCSHGTFNSVISNLNSAASPLTFDFRYGIGGFEATGTAPGAAIALPANQAAGAGAGNWLVDQADPRIVAPTFPNMTTLGEFTAATAQQVANSDILILRSSLPGVIPVYLNADTNGTGTIQVSSAGTLQTGQIVALSDCTKAVVFQISNAPAGAPANVSFAAAGGPPGNLVNIMPVPFVAGALLMPLTTSVYYIGQGQDGDTALRRLDLNGSNGPGQFTDEEIAPDIENMQVLYGIDTTGTLSPSQYVTADQVTQFDSVVAIKVAVLAAGPPNAGTGVVTAHLPYTLLDTTVTVPPDNRQRQVFTSQITLRSAVN